MNRVDSGCNQTATSRLAILGEFTPTFAPHAATNAAIEHSCAAYGLDIQRDWVSTAAIDERLFARYRGIWIAPGSPYRDLAAQPRAAVTTFLRSCIDRSAGHAQVRAETAGQDD
jgi:CTP synthase (UTP-ammonia lyase)